MSYVENGANIKDLGAEQEEDGYSIRSLIEIKGKVAEVCQFKSGRRQILAFYSGSSQDKWVLSELTPILPHLTERQSGVEFIWQINKKTIQHEGFWFSSLLQCYQNLVKFPDGNNIIGDIYPYLPLSKQKDFISNIMKLALSFQNESSKRMISNLILHSKVNQTAIRTFLEISWYDYPYFLECFGVLLHVTDKAISKRLISKIPIVESFLFSEMLAQVITQSSS